MAMCLCSPPLHQAHDMLGERMERQYAKTDKTI